ncbi:MULTISPECIES: hypothetical protein [Burkholderiaceae]|uniref:Uncharacterized protein n=1 Tax=Caballeronia sordidicola TaxID=196367 RepID=A0A242MNS5_CABSO|nr:MULTISPECIES: hypothetical protein [Burkholderiaceae]AME25960.1 hypothetical protein AXG89_18695 [Burkholderia sp. PAMC 26561]OTP72642.1 hypothetical protein PAMC26577_20280 [Caballeronia sordidicola]
MRVSLFAGVAMLCVGASAFAQQPPAFPMRSQNSAQVSIDNAMCYGYANQHTGVNMAKVSQVPIKPQATKPGAVKQVAVAAPLPSAMASGASAVYPASATGKASASASAPVMASGSASASAARPGVASDARAVANASSSSTDAPMPALPPPEPPMVQYWRAYSECMTERGYMVK